MGQFLEISTAGLTPDQKRKCTYLQLHWWLHTKFEDLEHTWLRLKIILGVAPAAIAILLRGVESFNHLAMCLKLFAT